MSDTQKPAEETPAAPTAEPTPAAEPAAATADEITPTETPAPAVEATEAEKKEETEPAEPVAAGHLGYKAPGLVNAFRFSKKYFWFGKEPVKTDDLHSYLRGEKPEIAHPVAAWSHQTGEGLLYFSKSADQKEKPSGVINLAHIEEVYKDGLHDFYFKLNGHKHIFQCNANERDAWVDAFKAKIEEAKQLAETITKSKEYDEVIEKLGKPATAPVTTKTEETPKKSTDKAPEGVKKDNASGSEEESGKKKPSRSISRKRASIFGSLLGKKEDAEAKKETKPEKEESKAAEGEEAKPVEPETTEPAPATEAAEPEGPALVAEGSNGPAAEQKDTPKPSKRGSIFGSILRREKKDIPTPVEEKKEDAAPAVPAKDAEPGPASEPTEETASKPVETSKPAETAEETPAPVSNSPKKGGFLNYFKERRHADKKEEPEAAPESEAAPKAEAAPKVDEPAAPAAEAETTAPAEPAAESTEAAATAEPSKARRRSSFFTDLVGKVGKKPGEVTSDSEGEPKEKSSPIPKIVGGLFRGASKAGRSKKEEAKKEATPATVEETPETAPTEEATPAAAEPKSEETPVAPEPSQTNVVNGAFGDVPPDAITVGQTPQQVQAAA